jgi:beta-glucosidase
MDHLCYSHGLSYTAFDYSNLELSEPAVSDDDLSLTASVTITNSGNFVGSEVVQLYIAMPATSDLSHPPLMLKSFTKVHDLEPGKSEKVQLHLNKYAVSYWEERISRWVVERGIYGVKVGPSSDRLLLEGTFKVIEGFEWNGL